MPDRWSEEFAKNMIAKGSITPPRGWADEITRMQWLLMAGALLIVILVGGLWGVYAR